MEVLTGSDFEGLRQALLVGTARRPLVVPPALATLMADATELSGPALPLLALTGQRLRFERPAFPAEQALPEVAIRLHSDPRPIVPDPARRALVRIVESVGREWGGLVVLAAARRVITAGFRHHPFDLPRLMTVLKPQGDELGPAEWAFVALAEANGWTLGPGRPRHEVTADNWTEAPSVARLTFLRQRRALDPAGTRAVLETVFSSLPALVRLDVVNALAIRISLDDLPLIERAAVDRSEMVKAAAASVRARVPGAPDHTERLAAAAACFQREGGGVAGKLLRLVGIASAVGTLTFVPPAGASGLRQGRGGLFEGFSLRELAAEVGVPVRELVGALPNEAAALPGFLARAVEDGDASTIQTLTLFKLLAGDRYPPGVELLDFVSSRILLSEEAAAEVLSSANWKDAVARVIDKGRDDGTLVFTAAMLSVAAMTAFLETIASAPGIAQAARAFADLVLGLGVDAPLSGVVRTPGD